MKLTTKWTTAAAIAVAAISGTANATATEWTDTIDFTPDRIVTVFSPVIFNHTLEDFTPGVDTIDSYSLLFDLYDDGDRQLETALVSQTGALFDSVYFNLSGVESGGWNLTGKWQIDTTGSLTVAISSLLGDFYLGSSTLTASGDKKSVPEPGVLALFGAALLGFGLMRRKRESN